MLEATNIERRVYGAEILEEENIIKTKNIYPEDHKYLTFLKKVFRHEFRKNGFRRLSTPFFEKRKFFENIFPNSVNDNVINFDLKDVGNIGLNPNPSIFSLKAYIEGERSEEIQPVYSYFMDRFYPKTMDRAIEGKSLFGGDVIGENDVIIDVQNLFIIINILNKIGLNGNFDVKVNFLGVKKEIDKYKEKLFEFYSDKKHLLTDQGLKYLENDIFKLLSSEDEDEQILAKSAPSISKIFKKDGKNDIENLKNYLDLLNINHIFDEKLFPDYDFNDGIVWEIKIKGNNEVLAKGYGYNDLSNLMGASKEIPGSGFWVDIFKIVKILKESNISIINKDDLDLFFVQLGDEAKKVVFPLSIQARDAGIKTAVSLGTPSMKEQILKAQRSGATYIVIVGLMEARNGIFQVRNLEAGTQEEVEKDNLIDYIIGKIGNKSLDFYDPSKDLLQK